MCVCVRDFTRLVYVSSSFLKKGRLGLSTFSNSETITTANYTVNKEQISCTDIDIATLDYCTDARSRTHTHSHNNTTISRNIHIHQIHTVSLGSGIG